MFCMRLLLLLFVAATLHAADSWTISLPVSAGAEQVIALDDRALVAGQVLRLDYRRQGTKNQRDGWLELGLTTADGRRFATAETLTLPGESHQATVRVPLDAAHWCGGDGDLGGDALAAVRELRLRLHGPNLGGQLDGTLTLEPPSASQASFALELLEPGLVDRGPWRELRLRLIGVGGGERGEVELVAQDDHRLPLFFEQPGLVVDGRWRARGPGRWVLRLRPDEKPEGAVRIEWRAGNHIWVSPVLPLSWTVMAREPLPTSPPQTLPVPQAPAWSGFPCRLDGAASLRLASVQLGSCPAPVLSWQAAWTGFRGPLAVSHPEAAAIDQVLAAGAVEIDLLPQGLLQEQGVFRFGLAPWHQAQGGPWLCPQDAFLTEAPWRQWRWHARELLARARATPGLDRWRLGLTQSANAPEEVKRLRDLLRDLAEMIGRLDRRSVLVLHPQAVDYAFREPNRKDDEPWFGFEDGTDGWTRIPLSAASTLSTTTGFASEGKSSLRLVIPLRAEGDGVRAASVARAVDANCFNLERVEFDAALDGPGEAQLYLWVTDAQHRWYQQPLALIAGNRRWNTVQAEFGDQAAWQPVGHDQPWTAESRRRIRFLGVSVYLHPPAGQAQTPAALHLDRFRRLGWPVEAAPVLAFQEVAVGGGDTVACWEPIRADFRLSVETRNPYDPEFADVRAELEAPDGKKLSYPCYWAEPFRLEVVDQKETAVPSGAGGWHWRFSPPTTGHWRWRLAAKVRYRDQTLEASGDWHDTTVSAPTAAAMPPVRVSARDPQWFETADGRWFYPLGINLRSPGDKRQDAVLKEVKGEPRAPGSSGLFASADYDRLGTRIYERWFDRLERAKMNWARVWMCPWWCGLEWRREWNGFGGLGVYNQASAACLDRVLELARQHRIYVQVELQNHGMVSAHVDAQWEDSPYNRRNGGPCATDADYFTSPEAWQQNCKRMRYVLARWGWHSHLAAWVLNSELEFTGAWFRDAYRDEEGGHSDLTQEWVAKGLAWFAANDPLARPVSVHFSHPWQGAKFWQMPGLGFSNSNAYTGFQRPPTNRLGGVQAGLGGALRMYLDTHFPPWELHRPTIIGEWGGHWESNSSAALSAELHVGLWLQTVMPYGGNVGFWWWLWVDAKDRWSEYAPIAAFVAGEDPRGLDYRPARPAVLASRQRSAAVMGMKSEREHRYYASLPGLSRDLGLTSDQDAGTFQVATDQPRSAWTVERWDCAKGVCIEKLNLRANDNGMVAVPLGILDPDAAFKLHRTVSGEK
jgi:hypothetical protein